LCNERVVVIVAVVVVIVVVVVVVVRKPLFSCLEKQLIELHLTALLQKGRSPSIHSFSVSIL